MGGIALARVLDRRRAHPARRRPALRDARRPVAPPRRDRHRRPHPRRRLRGGDGRRPRQRVGAAALLRAGLGLDPAGGDRRVRPALALGPRRGRHGPGRLPVRRRAPRPAGGDLRRRPRRGQPDAALVLPGGARLRAPRAPLRGLGALLRPLARARRRRDIDLVGRLLGAGPRHPLLRDLPGRGGGRLAAGAPRPRRGQGHLDRRPRLSGAGPARSAPDGGRARGMDRRPRPRPPGLGVRRDLPGRRDRRRHRPSRAPAAGPGAVSARGRRRSA